jgi:NitT/TauT family transport system substrate-binding protein
MNNDLSASITRREALRVAGGGAGALLGAGLLAGPAAGAVSRRTTARSASAMTTINDQLGWVKTSQWAGQYAAITKGYYKEEGIEDNLISGGPNIVASEVVAAGHATLCEDDNQSVLQLMAKGLPLIIFGTIYQRSPYSVISLASDPITTAKEFEGKTIALPPSTEAYLNPVLKKAGVDVSSVKYVPGNVLITTKSFLKSNEALLVRYLRATIKGWEYALAHPVEMAHLTVSKFAPPGDSYETELLNAQAQIPLIKNPAGLMKIDTAEMEEVIDGMLSAGALAKPLKASEVMTTDILEAVYGSSTSIRL